MHKFTPQQQSKLLANRNIQDVTEIRVSFTSDFKIKAVHQYFEGILPNTIFENAGIPIEYFKDDYCRLCLKKWIKKYKDEGEDGLKEDKRGRTSTGRPKQERLEDLTYEELLALVEIQQGALEELKKQNALARKKKL